MEKKILTASLRNGLFGDRGGDVVVAIHYAHQVINAMSESSDRAPAFTALHVVMNTIANAIDALELSADNPAAGVTGFEDALIKLIDQRLESRAFIPADALKARIDERINYWADDQFDSRVKNCLEDMDLTSDLDDKIQEYIDNSVDFTEIVRDELKQNITLSIEVD